MPLKAIETIHPVTQESLSHIFICPAGCYAMAVASTGGSGATVITSANLSDIHFYPLQNVQP